MATAPSPNDLTRQQLDELDALLQRMLTLPLSPPEPPPGPVYVSPPLPPPIPIPVSVPVAAPPAAVSFAPSTPALWRADPPSAPSPVAPDLLRFPAPSVAPRPTSPPADPLPVPVPTPRKAPPPREPADFREEPPVPPAVAPPPPAAVPVPVAAAPLESTPASEPVPLLVAPLVLFNRGLDAALGALGLPGRVLRSGPVKNLLGLAGVGLLVYTGVKVAQVNGWVSLPVPLPWPR